MRIAYVCCDRGVPIFGTKGASVHVRELCRALDEAGHEVLIVSPRTGGRRPLDFGPTVAEVTLEPEDDAVCSFLADDRAVGPTAAREVRALVYSAGLRFRLTSLLRDFGAEVVYERYALLATAGASAARTLRVPHILEVNAPLSQEQAEHRGLAFGHAARELEGATLRGADRVIAVSRAVAGWAAASGVEPARLSVRSNGVDPARFAVGTAERAVMRAQLGVGGAPVIGFLGTLKPWHDVASLIRATAVLVAAGLRVRLVLIGDGPERPRLEGLVRAAGLEPLTTFVGAVAYDDVPRYLSALDVAAVTYEASPGFYFSPLKLFEYLAAEKPVVAAAIGDIEHCIRHGATGLMYAPGDVRALADALLALITDPERASRLAQAGREHVRIHHTWAGNADTVVALAEAAAQDRTREAAWA
jgi:glycosyltransferase involved in cell wall biosynthesis